MTTTTIATPKMPVRRSRAVGRLRAVGGRAAHLLLVLFLVTLATFFLLELVPGDPAIAVLGAEATPEQYEVVREELGLDEPPLSRYAEWLGDAVTGDLGTGLLPPRQEVTDQVLARLPVTIELTAVAVVIALALAVPLAMWSALRVGTRVDRIIGSATYGVISIPSFLGGLFLIFFLVFRPELVRDAFLACGFAGSAWALVRLPGRLRAAVPEDRRRAVRNVVLTAAAAAAAGLLLHRYWPAFPRQGFSRLTDEAGIRENLRTVFLPALTLGLIEGAIFLRVLRSDLIATLQEDFVLAARAKGMSTAHILFREALRPSSFSLVTVAGVSLGRLFGGAVVVEAIFRLPGLGSMIVQGVNNKDYPIVQGAVLAIAVVYVLVNAVVDASYTFLDPRIRRGR